MTKDRCPFCGAGLQGVGITPTTKYCCYKCGSRNPGKQSDKCKDRQIATFKAQLADYEERLKVCRAAIALFQTCFPSAIAVIQDYEEMQELSNLGEL